MGVGGRCRSPAQGVLPKEDGEGSEAAVGRGGACEEPGATIT